jgi:GR25 family glycosyltransferase involved in LPS biosynthesis
MILNNFPKVLWINLDKSINRRKYMESLLSFYIINNQRITAINGTNLNSEFDNVCIPNKKLSRAENACTCSHLKAMEYFINNMNDDKIIIFEDDVSFDFLDMIPYNWSDFEKKLPNDYQVIQLAITYENGPIDCVLIKTDPSTKYYCSAAYMITREGAKNLLSRYRSTVDNKFDLSIQEFATADSMISSSGSTYSIPIFTYKTSESTIHPKHSYIHNKSKSQQLIMWKNNAKMI